ncbi:MAG: SOS response-associated peptidase family protein [Gammaproteobacteria bacterium]|nr:SOS response-associated peptidase family protein [Gammaproteobacteria bacterium]MDP2346341.1 SOS response-associated peptidase family protein [Gammaproteobacteria bacterium]
MKGFVIKSGRTVRQPYFISAPAQEVIAFAGLWSVWERPGASPIISCALLSREPQGDNLNLTELDSGLYFAHAEKTEHRKDATGN